MLFAVIACINNYHKSSIKPWGAYLIPGPKRGGLNREGEGLISNHIFSMEGHNNFPYFTFILITKTEQENGFVSHFTNATSFIP